MGPYWLSTALAAACAVGLVAARPLVSLNLLIYRLLRLRQLADFWEARREATVTAVRVVCSLLMAISVLEMIFRRAHLG